MPHGVPEARARTVVVAGAVLVGRLLEVTALGGVPAQYLAAPIYTWVDGAGAAAAVGVRAGRAQVVLAADVGDDEEGRACLERLTAAGIDTTHLRVRTGVATGALSYCLLPSGPQEPVAVTTPPADRTGGLYVPDRDSYDRLATEEVAALLARTRPGDCLLLDGFTLAREPELIEAALEADLQLVADLRPLPPFAAGSTSASGVQPQLFERIDVAVVDTEGAGMLAESGAMFGSTLVLDGGYGASWDGALRSVPEAVAAAGGQYDRWATVDATSAWAQHAFCGRLAAELAHGRDREEALDAALLTWWQQAHVDAGKALGGYLLGPLAEPEWD
ncbi:sugar/nucleoside kinase (ribokinase family) [Kineosphaera limosa]|uniref:Carbohydrate kinase PfkB domain-containing protein n=1 Tax=Kineosphaera limosa NBRC 100340 TaxID=1184609 RepID=K6W4M9_9MICO|nr:carbohydrate kinase family protein [Kineosphaera limosa]NYE02260.1 sugar/nucleoside kinase (ribokinase family) [Kineosphaera limosa]GAB94115.1 hypothetical protein KILIM_003_00370 [Kineosphaera limosa NBRC 100340]